MIEKNFYLFEYLKKLNIVINKNDFIFQFQSHSEYPNLLSISDTLFFFKINNRAFQLDFKDLELLPNLFVASLNDEKNEHDFFLIEKKDNQYFIIKNNISIEISTIDLEKRWSGVIFLIGKSNYESSHNNRNKINLLLSSFCFIGFLMFFFGFESNLISKLFILFPTIGIFFSVVALKDLFGLNIDLINNFCKITTSSSCESILSSDKWKIFSYINFSDLAIVFFSSQFLGLLTILVSGNSIEFFSIQSILLFGSIPVILLSLYFQKFVEKKWCPICMVIILIIILEIVYLIYFFDFNFQFSFKSLLLFGLVFLITALIWNVLKRLLNENKYLKENELKSNRFIRNYEIFKNTLISKEKAEFPFTPFVLGNKYSKTIITIITSPFCGFCKEAFDVLDNIFDKHSDNLQIQILFKINIYEDNMISKSLFDTLYTIYLEKGAHDLRKAIKDWYEYKDYEKWAVFYDTCSNFDVTIPILKNQNDWLIENNLNFSPIIFINGYQYPEMYERVNLKFFINELLEDKDF